MKTKIELILGFLESGKTSFINSMLEDEKINNETIIILQDELGQANLNCSLEVLRNKKIKLITIENDTDDDIDENYIKNIILRNSPDRIFIEANGMKNCSALLEIFNNNSLKKLSRIDDVITLINAQNFNLYFRNLRDLFAAQITNSSKIIFNNLDKLKKDKDSDILAEIRKLNETAELIEYSPSKKSEFSLEENYFKLNNNADNNFTFKSYIYIFLIIFAFTLLSVVNFTDITMYPQYLSKFKQFYTIFLSILIEGIPFILLGSFVSSLMQVLISKEFFIKIFPNNIFLSCIIAAFAGIIFPICDCGTIPLVKGFIRKKVPLAACITFMLCAPIVNPISIMAAIYAFQGMRSVITYRILCAIIISISVALIMQFFVKNEEDILKEDNVDMISCDCAVCSQSSSSYDSRMEKIKTIFLHTSDEFFNIGRFMILGTFTSSIFQCFVGMNNSSFIPNDNRSSLIVMMLIAFFLSVCSTSDAFVAKGFLKGFSLNSVMGFLVMGPMLDIKNTFMLFSSFKKVFVLKLIFLIFTISFTVLINFNLS